MTWILAGLALLLAAAMAAAWINGGPQPVHTIEQPASLPVGPKA